MKRKRYTDEQIIPILKQHEGGRTMVDLAREYRVAQNTLYRWKSKFGGMEAPCREVSAFRMSDAARHVAG